MTAAATDALERYTYVGLVVCLGLIQLTIFGNVPLMIAGLLWLAILIRTRRWPPVPAFFLPLVALAAWTLVSSVFSSEPAVSFLRDRQLLYYLIVPLTMQVARGSRAATAVNFIIAFGAASALIGVAEYFLGPGGPIRPAGLLGKNYMTYSGVIMLVTCAALAKLVYRGSEWIWPAVAVPALLVALFASQSRNAYLGALAALVCLLSLKNWKLLAAVPALVAIFLVAAPAPFRDRALSVFDSTNATVRDRISMLKSGVAMIEDHPLFGVGPNMVTKAYGEKYKRADAVDPVENPGASRSHLHNVPVQLAAERGLPAAAAWLWFVIAAGAGLFRLARRGPERALAAIGLAALVAAVVAGLFEHNFGDSEFLVLFLGLISLPFAAALASGEPSAGAAVPVRRPASSPPLEARV